MAVRREKVILELEDHFTTEMALAAAAAALLDKNLDGLSKSAVETRRPLRDVGAESDNLRRSVDRSSGSINQLTGRLRLMADAAAILGPSLVPISAVAVPAVTGLASQLGFATLGMTSLVVASQGVGDALKAVNDAALEPTAANLEKARVAMAKLGPEAQAFVTTFQDLRPVLGDIRDAAAAGWFPGLTEALGSFEAIAPRLATLFEAIGAAGGNLVADGAEALTGPQWAEFLTFVESNAPQALDELGRTVGNVIKGLSELWMAFDPLNDDFSSWLLDASRAFAEWSEGLSQTQGFADFVDYIRTNGPRVADALAALGNALVQIVEALAPLGGPSLKIIETFANAIAAIADSDLGTPIFAAVAAFAALNRVLQVTAAMQTKITGSSALGAGLASGGVFGGLKAAGTNLQAMNRDLRSTVAAAGKAGAVLGGLALATSGVADGFGLSNTASLALMGTMVGPWGAAIGAGVGAVMDLSAANKELEESTRAALAAMDTGSVDRMVAELARLEAQLSEDRGWWAETGDAVGTFFRVLGDPGGDHDLALVDAKQAARDLNDELAITKQLAQEGFNGTGLTETLLGPLADTAVQAHNAAMELDDLKTAFEGILGLLSKQDAWDNYQAAIDAVTESIKENGRTLDATTEKGRNNRDAINGIADAAISVAENLNGLDRINFLNNARAEFRQAAIDAGGLDARARDILAAFDELIGKPVKPKIDDRDVKDAQTNALGLLGTIGKVDDSEANPWVRLYGVPQANSQLNDLTKPRTIAIQAFFLPPKGRPPGTGVVNDPFQGPLAANNSNGKADGGTVLGQRQPYGDKVLSMLAPGEEVITNRNGEADRFRADRAAGRIPAYADGGTVRPISMPAVYVPSMSSNVGPLVVSGTLVTPWGPAHIEGIARASARDEIDQHNTWSKTQQ